MKKFCLLAVIIFLFVSNIYSQLKANQWMAGGTLDYARTHDENNQAGLNSKTTMHNMNLAPGIGLLAADRLCIGLRFAFVDSKSKSRTEGVNPFFTNSTDYETKTSGSGLSPFVRYYVLPAKTKWNVFAELGYAYLNQTIETKLVQLSVPSGGGIGGSASSTTSKSKNTYNTYSLAAGPAFFISPQVSIELSIGYSIGKGSGDNHTTDQLAIGTGFQVFFGGKK